LHFMRLAWHRTLGRGALALVRTALVIERGKPQAEWIEYAVKVMQKEQVAAEGTLGRVHDEVAVLQLCDHPNIIAFVAYFEDDKRQFIVTQFAPNGDLFEVLRRWGSVDAVYARLVTAEVARALAYLHERGVVHFDFKPENVLLNDDGHVLLADLGSAMRVDVARDNTSPLLLTGTAEYVAVELAQDALARVGDSSALCVQRALVTPAVDWWALGCVLYQLLRGQPPFTLSRVAAATAAEAGVQAVSRDILRTIVQQATTIGPLFVARRRLPDDGSVSAGVVDDGGDIDACERAVRGLLVCNPAARWSLRAAPAVSFFELPVDFVLPMPRQGAVAPREIVEHVKQRKFSMLFSAMTQKTFAECASEPLAPIDEIEGC